VFAEADQGTLLLDEINSCPLHLQAKLLRVIERGEVRSVGGRGERRYDFRTVTASNMDLLRLVDTGQFRHDLFSRLNGVMICMPALAERSEDIPFLIQHFVHFAGQREKRSVQLQSDAIAVLMNYNWPGNVRELKYCIESIIVCADSPIIRAADINVMFEWAKPDRPNATQSERIQLMTLLKKHRRKVNDAAAALGIDRSTLYRRLRRMGIRSSSIMLDDLP